jgi:hypothetical protein
MLKKCMCYKQISVKALKKLLNGERFKKKEFHQKIARKNLFTKDEFLLVLKSDKYVFNYFI